MGNQSVIADGLANLPEALVWVFIGKHTHFIALRLKFTKRIFCGSKIHCEFALFDT